MRAFIIRPFGVKSGIDFDAVERELIAPVLDELEIAGRTTGEIARAGNIRTDMFEALVLADIVVADISIHNANAYYELGVRHALRDRGTVLIRCRGDEVPFDLKTDRYLSYPRENAGAAREELKRAIEATLRHRETDSPVYLLLRDLRPPDESVLAPVPPGFQEAVENARRTGDLALLGLLAEETRHQSWEIAGLRCVGEAQFKLGALHASRATWEKIRRRIPDSVAANGKLATIHQRLGDMAASDAAIDRVLHSPRATPSDRAEVQALAGSNWKTRWMEDWRNTPPESRQAAALESPALQEAFVRYLAALHEDLNAFYPGINALALARARMELAQRLPEVWASLFESEEDAARELEVLRERSVSLDGAVRHAIDAAEERLRRAGEYNIWLDLTRADYHFLTSNRSRFVAQNYSRARERLQARVKTGGANRPFPANAAARQIRLFLELELLQENARAALSALEVPEQAPPAGPESAAMRVVVFTGHRVDEEGRTPPRFPNTPEIESVARNAIRKCVEVEMAAAVATGAAIHGVGGGANGGDILFHEVCSELGVASTVLLALPPDAFAARSVESGGPTWVERFRRLCRSREPRVLSSSEALPDWLVDREGYSIWERNNLWTLHTALAHEGAEVTLLALWNGEAGDGPGGTRDMLALARERGVRVVHLDTNELFGFSSRTGTKAGREG